MADSGPLFAKSSQKYATHGRNLFRIAAFSPCWPPRASSPAQSHWAPLSMARSALPPLRALFELKKQANSQLVGYSDFSGGGSSGLPGWSLRPMETGSLAGKVSLKASSSCSSMSFGVFRTRAMVFLYWQTPPNNKKARNTEVPTPPCSKLAPIRFPITARMTKSGGPL